MSVTLTIENVVKAVEEAVELKGSDYVYPSNEPDPLRESVIGACQYVRSGAPSCLVGHALVSLGVPLNRLASFDLQYANSAKAVLDTLYAEAIIDFENAGEELDEIETFLMAAQGKQDEGFTWGEALTAARHKVGLVTA